LISDQKPKPKRTDGLQLLHGLTEVHLFLVLVVVELLVYVLWFGWGVRIHGLESGRGFFILLLCSSYTSTSKAH